jgi:hypothetical protein
MYFKPNLRKQAEQLPSWPRPAAFALAMLGHFDAYQRSVQSHLSPAEVHGAGCRGAQALFGPAPGGLGSLYVNFLGPLCRIGQDGNPVGAHLHKASTDSYKHVFLASLTDGNLARDERRHQGSMMGQDAQHPINPRREHHVHAIRKDDALDAHHVTLDGHGTYSCHIFSAASRTSSMPPCM